jgi:hypothetical protein
MGCPFCQSVTMGTVRGALPHFNDTDVKTLRCVARRPLADALHDDRYRTASPADDRELPLQSHLGAQ